MVDLLSAITLCHSLDIWHRDIKPDNVLLSDSNRAVLIDFSHSVHLNKNIDPFDLLLDTEVVTYTYRAPELFKYKDNLINTYDEKIDIWSLGVILFELITDENFIYKTIGDVTEDGINIYFNSTIGKEAYLAKTYLIYYELTKGTQLKHATIYWQWIVEMLQYRPVDRISAIEMLDRIILFAKAKNYDITIPICKNVNTPPKLPVSYAHNQEQLFIFNQANHFCKKFRNVMGYNYKLNIVTHMLNELFYYGKIKKKNIMYTSLALLLLTHVDVYDQHISNVSDAIDHINKTLKLTLKKFKLQVYMSKLIYLYCNELSMTIL